MIRRSRSEANQAALPAPVRLRRRVRLVVTTMLLLVRLEVRVRSRTLPQLCAEAGVAFSGFDRPEGQPRTQPMARRIADVWWAVEVVLRMWPWARRRPCLRRSLLLGRQLRHLSPHLVLEVVRLAPLVAHAVLVVDGQRLDMGELDPAASIGQIGLVAEEGS